MISIGVQTGTGKNIKRDFERQLKLVTKEDLKDVLEDIKSLTITTSKEAFREERTRGFDDNPLVLVDGRPNREENVRYLGKIEYVARVNFKEMVLAIFDKIYSTSRVDTGLYREMNWVFVNNKVVAKTRAELDAFMDSGQLKQTDSMQFANRAPYAHRLERLGVNNTRTKTRLGKSRDKKQRSGPMVMRPNGTYHLAYRSVKRLYGNNVTVKFELLPLGYLGLSNALPGLRKDYSPEGKYKKGDYLHPTITIFFDKQGQESLSLVRNLQ